LDKNTEAFISNLIIQERKLADSYHQVATCFGLSDGEFWVLYCLTYSRVEWTQSLICKTLEMSKQTVHSIIQKLISRGYVFLDAESASRNQKQIKTTKEGETYLSQTLQQVRQAESKTYRTLGKPLMDQYLELDKTINTTLSKFLGEIKS